MRVLHVVSTLDPEAGGVSQAVRTIIKSLSELGVVNEVASVDVIDSPFIQADSFKIYALGPGKTSWKYSGTLLAWLKNNLKNYQCVVVHGLWQYQTNAVYKALKSNKNVRCLVMPHGMLDPYFQKAKGRKLKAIRNSVIWSIVEKQLLNSADGVLYTCETEMILARHTFNAYLPKKEYVVGLGVEEPPKFNVNMNIALKEIMGEDVTDYMLFISRIHEKKGVDLLIKAYLKLQSEGIKLPSLIVAGPGLDTDYGLYIKKLAGGNNKIFFPGMLSGDSKWGAFYGAGVFILPSHQENFGIAVVEALACGVPVLISKEVNIWREIEAGQGGIVAADTEEGTVELIKKYLTAREDNSKTMNLNARKVYEEQFSIASNAMRFKATLESNNI